MNTTPSSQSANPSLTDTAINKEKPTGGLVHQMFEMVRSRLALSVGAQALVSGFHFGLNLLLLRLVSPYEYGVFAFAFVMAMFASAVNNALISTPLTVYTPVLKDPQERTEQEAMFSTLNLALFGLLLVIGLVYTGWSQMDGLISLGVPLFVAVYSARHYSRSAGYARMRPLVTASGDTTYVLTGVALVAMLLLRQSPVTVGEILIALALANLAAMLIERFRLHGTSHRWLTLSRIGGYRQIWAQSRWALIGSLTTLFLAQAHSVIITSTNGPNAYAPLAAGFVLFGPVRVALLTWQNMVKPEMAVDLSEFRQAAVLAQIRTTTVYMVAAVIALAVGIWIGWQWIYEYLYAEQYADQPMGMIVAIWSIVTVFGASYNAPAAALQAMKDFRVLAMASIYGAIISGVLVSFTLYLFRPEITLFGILTAEVFMALFLTHTLYTRLTTRP